MPIVTPVDEGLFRCGIPGTDWRRKGQGFTLWSGGWDMGRKRKRVGSPQI